MAQNGTGNVLTGEAKVEIIRSYGGSERLPKPEKVFIHDFALVGDIIMDDSLAARLKNRSILRHGSDEDLTPEGLARQVQVSFSKTLAAGLKKVNLPSEIAPEDAGTERGPALIIDGEFTSINQGDMSKRIMVGFGRGASDVNTHVVVSAIANGKRTIVLDFNLKSESGKKPGAIVGASSVAVAVAAGDIGDKKSTVQADASRMAKAATKQIEAFMVTQNWIPNHSD